MAKLIIEGIPYSPAEFCKAFGESSQTELRELAHWIANWNSGIKELTLHTSGSTGAPKSLTLARSAFVASAQLTAATFGLAQGTNALLCLPVAYVAGKMMVVRALVNDWNLYWVPPTSHVTLDLGVRIDFAAMTPMQVEASIFDLSPTINKLIIGGSPLKADLWRRLGKIETECYETYGMTETLTHIAIRKVHGVPFEVGFQPLKGIKCGLDSRGCLSIEAKHISSSTISTNDVVKVYEDGSFNIVGRVDNVINSGGIKLFPEQLEAEMAHLLTAAYYIKGEPSDQLGERAVLVVESDPWSNDRLDAFLGSLRSLLPSTHIPKAIYFEPRLDRTKSGKIIRNS